MAQFELVIFDCDGVLVDRERISNQVFADMPNELGSAATLDYMFERFAGHSMGYCVDLVTKLIERPVPANVIDRYREQVIGSMAELPSLIEAGALS